MTVTERYEIAFDSAGASCAVFDCTEGGQRESGVRVTLATGREVVIRCAPVTVGRIEALEARLPCDADNALSVGRCVYICR